MSTDSTPVAGVRPAWDDPAAVEAFLRAYTPTALDEHTWEAVREDAIGLVLAAGDVSRQRVENDIQVLTVAVGVAVTRNRAGSVAEAVSDATLIDLDAADRAAGLAEATRRRRRGVMRRLQATHRGLPWRRARRADGERVTDLVPPTATADLAALLEQATAAGPEEAGAVALLAAVKEARRARRDPAGPTRAGRRPRPERRVWDTARQFGQARGVHMTEHWLNAAVTHEVLLTTAEPLAVLVPAMGLTRRDLDLALTHHPDPCALSQDALSLLRGAPATPAGAA